MIQPNNRIAAFEGHHIKSKMFLGLTLTSIIPLLILRISYTSLSSLSWMRACTGC
jgi:hypothetical protein